jgi:quinolinate synthase
MDRNQTAKEILRLKKEKAAVLLVHNYQRGEIQEMADFLGDSLDLSRKASQVSDPMIVFCGVKFMAETAKILSPEKKVLLPRQDANCPMAEMVDVGGLKKLKTQHPEAVVVTYVNSTAEVKAESDVCCTSANAIQVVKNIDAEEIIFTPDRNLASYVQRFTRKKIIPWDGFCYVHDQFTREEVLRARQVHPDALLMVHPECSPEVIDEADEVLSTSGMVRVARESSSKEFLVGTEEGMLYRLKKENPNKTFYSAGTAKMCIGMKRTRLEDLYQAFIKERYAIEIHEEVMNRARTALEKMLTYV